MNIDFYNDLDTNFEQALCMAAQDFSHEELIAMLKNGNVPQKQIAALKLDRIDNHEEANVLLSNLTGCDGKIREAVALKINTILNENPKFTLFNNSPEIFANASIDINGNICRLVIDSVSIIKNEKTFADIYLNKILYFIQEAFSELDKFIFRDKKYVINKQLFKLYWAMEAIKLFANDLDDCILLPILEKAASITEYTIREKVAQIVIIKDASAYSKLKELLINDENYYVRNVFATN